MKTINKSILPIKPILYFDQDETFVNLSKAVIGEHNKDFDENYNYKQNQSYFWQDTKKPQKYFEEVLDREGLFLNAEPIEDMIECIMKLHNEGYEIFVITNPQENEFCAKEKKLWCKKYLPFIYEERRLIATPHKHLFANNQSILVDDNMDYLIPFEVNGGHSICMGDYGWNKEYRNNRCKNGKEVYKLIHKITDNINSKNINKGDVL